MIVVRCPRCWQTWEINEPLVSISMKLSIEVSLSFHLYYGTPFECVERGPEFVEYSRTG